MYSDIRIAELISTRLCHDLTGPIGAVNNGSEFLADEDGSMQSDALDLIASSAKEAVSRLQFYRQAYGRVNGHGEASLSEKKEAMVEFFEGTKIALDWPDQYTDAANVPVSLRMARLVFNLVIIVSGAMIRGGKLSIRVGTDADNQPWVVVRGEGQGVKVNEDILIALEENMAIDDLTPKTVQPHLTRKMAAEIDAALQISRSDDHMEIKAMRNAIE